MSSISILKKSLNTIKIKLLDCQNIQKYINIYQEIYNSVWHLITKDLKLSIKKAYILL